MTHAEQFLRAEAIEESFIRASGPGGQNVNKVASAVQLRFFPERAGLPGQASITCPGGKSRHTDRRDCH